MGGGCAGTQNFLFSIIIFYAQDYPLFVGKKKIEINIYHYLINAHKPTMGSISYLEIANAKTIGQELQFMDDEYMATKEWSRGHSTKYRQLKKSLAQPTTKPKKNTFFIKEIWV